MWVPRVWAGCWSGSILLLKVLESWSSERPFLVFGEDNFCINVVGCSCKGIIRIHFKTTDVKIGIACWSGFWIFKKNWENPDEIRMVGQSVILYCTYESLNTLYTAQLPSWYLPRMDLQGKTKRSKLSKTKIKCNFEAHYNYCNFFFLLLYMML